MPNMDKLFGIHPQALIIRSQRTSLLASNLANADTPNFKARDIDFKAALSEQQEKVSFAPKVTSTGHIPISGGGNSLSAGSFQYRVPYQASLDGNTVESDVEQSQYAENAIRYQASLTFLNGKISGMIKALTGE